MMKVSLALLGCVWLLCGGASAWGGLFNRFNPSMLSNLGYGGSYGRELYGVSDKAAVDNVSCLLEPTK